LDPASKWDSSLLLGGAKPSKGATKSSKNWGMGYIF